METYLNGKKISCLQATSLSSGDRINIEDLTMCFEICNLDLEKQLQVIEAKEGQQQIQENHLSPISNNLPQTTEQAPQGAIRIPSPVKKNS